MTNNKSIEGIIDILVDEISEAWEKYDGADCLDDFDEYEVEYDKARRKAISDINNQWDIVVSGKVGYNYNSITIDDESIGDLIYGPILHCNKQKIQIGIRKI